MPWHEFCIRARSPGYLITLISVPIPVKTRTKHLAFSTFSDLKTSKATRLNNYALIIRTKSRSTLHIYFIQLNNFYFFHFLGSTDFLTNMFSRLSKSSILRKRFNFHMCNLQIIPCASSWSKNLHFAFSDFFLNNAICPKDVCYQSI